MIILSHIKCSQNPRKKISRKALQGEESTIKNEKAFSKFMQDMTAELNWKKKCKSKL